jgi:hypothetical protein
MTMCRCALCEGSNTKRFHAREGFAHIDHVYCMDCKAHRFRGEWVDARAWDAWVNGGELLPTKIDLFGAVAA